MRTRAAGAAVGLVFGFTIVWSGMTSPSVIRGALLFEDSYLFLFFGAAVITATIGLAVVRRRGGRALLTGVPIAWSTEAVQRRHVAGAFIFGVGWGITNVCPGPAATAVGQGIGWSFITFAGIVLGVRLFQHREARETEPAVDVVVSPSASWQPQPAASA